MVGDSVGDAVVGDFVGGDVIDSNQSILLLLLLEYYYYYEKLNTACTQIFRDVGLKLR